MLVAAGQPDGDGKVRLVLNNPLADHLPVDVATLAATRDSLHRMAEHVLSADLYRHTGRIGLRPSAGGFATPPVIVDGTAHQVRVEGVDLVVANGELVQRAPITTVADAALLVGVEPGGPPVYATVTPDEPDRPLEVDAGASAAVADWLAFGATALDRIAAGRPDVAGPAQLWPEHFDLAIVVTDGVRGETVLGVSPGDDEDPEPYAYVAPATMPTDDDWWNRRYGHWSPATSLGTVDDLVDVFEHGLLLVR